MEIANVTNKVAQTPEKGYEFLLCRMYYAGDDGYQNFRVFALMFSSHVYWKAVKKLLTGH